MENLREGICFVETSKHLVVQFLEVLREVSSILREVLSIPLC